MYYTERISTQAVYKANQDFRDYVDRYARERELLVTEALTHKTVEEVADYYVKLSLEKENGK